MVAKRSKAECSPRITPAFRLFAAACIALALSFLSAQRRVLSDATWRPLSTQSTGPWDIQQQSIVEVEVDVRCSEDATLLQGMGYSCAIGVCQLELPAGEELALAELGLPVQVVARAIKVTGGAALAEQYEFGSNYSNYYIADEGGSGCGPTTHSPIYISEAPLGATVTRVTFTARIEHPYVEDLEVWLQNFQHSATAWERWGGSTDQGYDDDPEDDNDIELWLRTFDSKFDGDQVNQTWWLCARDCRDGNIGSYDYWMIYVYYDCISVMPGTASAPSPADGATNQSVDVDLDWEAAAHATSYDVYFGTDPRPPPLGTTSSSSYALPTLDSGTVYYWRIVAKNKCGDTIGPVWDFTTSGTPPTTPTRTRTPSPTPTHTVLSTPTGTAVATLTKTPTATPTATTGATPTGTLVATLTRTATCSPPDTPSGPFPADGATNQSINVDLNWADAPGAASYDVYFGTSTSPPWYATTSASKHALPLLSSSTHYYWKIVAKNSCGEAAGPVWDFTTAGGETFLTIHLPILLR